MFARLWWKDTRQFWPIWGLLVIAAGVAQMVTLRFGGDTARLGMLALFAVGWTMLYAVAVGAAAFAGEREMGTLALLDALPVSRRLLWGGKVSFALASTLGLALVMLTMAALSTDRWALERADKILIPLAFTALMIEAIGWGLFWSARSNNALTAAVLGITCTLLVLPLVGAATGLYQTQSPGFGMFEDRTFVATAPWRLVLAALTFAASARVMIRPPQRFADGSPGQRLRARTGLHFRAPLVVEAPEPTPGRLRKPLWAELRVLVWQALREGWSTWWILAALILGALVLTLQPRVGLDPAFVGLLAVTIGLTAGVSVFNVENRDRTHRFLAHHGARPGLVWLVKLAVWTFGLWLLFVATGVVSLVLMAIIRPAGTANYAAVLIAPAIYGSFAVGQLCGMVVRRGITAWVTTVLVLLLVWLPLGLLLSFGLLPPVEGLLVPPLALLAVSWAWRRDWMFERSGPGRWVRLGLLVTGAVVVCTGLYISERRYGVPDADPIPPPAGWHDVVPEAENAAPLYEKASQTRDFSPKVRMKWSWREKNAEKLALIRRASLLPHCQFARPDRRTIASAPFPHTMPGVDASLNFFMANDTQNCIRENDLDAAWDALMVRFRMSRHFAEGGDSLEAWQLDDAERRTLMSAMEWSNAPGQTAARVRAALKAYRDLPPMPSPSDLVKAEAQVVEQTLTLPTETLETFLIGRLNPGNRGDHTYEAAQARLMLLPWERVRTRNAARLLMAEVFVQSGKEPWQRDNRFIGGQYGGGMHLLVSPDSVLGKVVYGIVSVPPDFRREQASIHAIMTTPLLRLLTPNFGIYLSQGEMNEVGRRALVIYLALRAYQLDHGGWTPDRLDALVPAELPAIPLDPYGARPFSYRMGDASCRVRPLSQVLEPGVVHVIGKKDVEYEDMTNRRLFYSVGPDHQDDHAVTSYPERRSNHGDIIFPLPPEPATRAVKPEVKLPDDPFGP
jgi:hypothetical protein